MPGNYGEIKSAWFSGAQISLEPTRRPAGVEAAVEDTAVSIICRAGAARQHSPYQAPYSCGAGCARSDSDWSRCSCARCVEPSMSVKRKVTVPEGRLMASSLADGPFDLPWIPLGAGLRAAPAIRPDALGQWTQRGLRRVPDSGWLPGPESLVLSHLSQVSRLEAAPFRIHWGVYSNRRSAQVGVCFLRTRP